MLGAHVRRYELNAITGKLYPSTEGVILSGQQLMDIHYLSPEILEEARLRQADDNNVMQTAISFHVGNNAFIEVLSDGQNVAIVKSYYSAAGVLVPSRFVVELTYHEFEKLYRSIPSILYAWPEMNVTNEEEIIPCWAGHDRQGYLMCRHCCPPHDPQQ